VRTTAAKQATQEAKRYPTLLRHLDARPLPRVVEQYLDARDVLSGLRAIAKGYRVPLEALFRPTRNAVHCKARRAMWRWLREEQGWSYPLIAEVFGADHSSVYKGVQKANYEQVER